MDGQYAVAGFGEWHHAPLVVLAISNGFAMRAVEVYDEQIIRPLG